MLNPILQISDFYDYDKTLFDDMELPAGMDKNTMIDYILMYCGDSEVRYGEPALFKRFMNAWFRANKSQFARIWYTMNAEYNPLENLRREEGIERDRNEAENTTNNSSVNSSSESDGTDSRSGEEARNNKRSVSAFDSTSLQPRDAEEESGTNSESGTTHSESSSESNGNATGSRDNTEHESTRTFVHGSIGVITTQTMVKQEREIADFDLYYYIVMKFEDEFTVPVYARREDRYGFM